MLWESLKPEEIGKGFPLSFAANIGMAKWSVGDCRVLSWDKYLSENDTDKFKHLQNRVRVEISTNIDSDTVLIEAMKGFLNSFGLPNMKVLVERS